MNVTDPDVSSKIVENAKDYALCTHIDSDTKICCDIQFHIDQNMYIRVLHEEVCAFQDSTLNKTTQFACVLCCAKHKMHCVRAMLMEFIR